MCFGLPSIGMSRGIIAFIKGKIYVVLDYSDSIATLAYSKDTCTYVLDGLACG